MSRLAAFLTATVAVVATTTSQCRADRYYRFLFEGTITRIEGIAPFGVGVGDPMTIQYVFDLTTPDTDPDPAIGSYPAVFQGTVYASMGSRPPDGGLVPAPITVINDSARGDVYRFTFAQNILSGSVECIDAQSAAVDSDALMLNMLLDDYNDKGDVAEMTFQFGSVWRAVGTINRFERTRFFCRCDWNHSDYVTSQDFFDFVTDFFNGEGDYNGDKVTNTQDFFGFLSCFFTEGGLCL